MTEHVAKQSHVLGTPAAPCATAQVFFANKLHYETDPADVYTDMQNGVADFVLLDVRSPEAYARSHIPGAVNLPQTMINAETTAHLAPETVMVVYCWGPGCNGATKAAIKLSALGFLVKEMIGGMGYWEDRERYPVQRGAR
jgi:rhodanese-related sulfurtransferase